jgi:hypothetical protein
MEWEDQDGGSASEAAGCAGGEGCPCARAVDAALTHLGIALQTASAGLPVDWSYVSYKIGIALGGIEVAEGEEEGA